MPQTINWPGFSAALQRAFGLKGRIPLAFDETVVPTAQVVDVDETPWGLSIPCGVGQSQPAVALNNSIIALRPGLGTVLRVDQILISNPNAAAREFSVRIQTAVMFAAMAIVATRNLARLDYLSWDSNGDVARLGSLAFGCTRVGAQGTGLHRIEMAANATFNLVLANPVYMDGNRPNVGALIVANETVNEACRASFVCREYVNRA